MEKPVSPVQIHSSSQSAKQIADISKILALPMRRRGNFSDRFKKVEIISNLFQVTTKLTEKIVIYSVKYQPQINSDNSKLRNTILSKLKDKISQFIKDPILSSYNIFSQNQSSQVQCQFTYQQYKITIKKVKIFDLKANPKILLAFLGNTFRATLSKLGYVEIGKSGKYFNGNQRSKIDNLLIFSGYKATFSYLEKGLFLKIDSAKKIVREQTVLNVIQTIYVQHKQKDKDEKRMLVKQQLIGKIVMANYGKSQYYKIEDINFSISLEDYTFDDKNMNLLQYYDERYKLKIKDKKQPLLKVEGKNSQREILLIPQFCLMTGIPDNFDEFRRKSISEKTIINPEDKRKQINKLINQLSKTDSFDNLKGLGITIDEKMSTVPAKMIPTPKIQLGNKNSVQQGKQNFFNLFNQPIFQSKHSIKLGIVHFKNMDISQLENVMKRTSPNLGVQMKIEKYAIDNVSKRPINEIKRQVQKAEESQCNICLIVLMNSMTNIYKDLKQFLLTEKSIISQVATERTMRKKNLQSIATKILLQIIAKRGNTLWVPKLNFEVNDIMMTSFDSGSLGGQSIQAICATINSTFTSISSKFMIAKNQNEKYKVWTDLFLKIVDSYFSRNKKYPKEIIIFMSSCPNDQINIIYQQFIQRIQSKLKEVCEDIRFGLTVILYNPRNTERFFTMDSPARNVPAGTVIADKVVSQNYNFFIISQQSFKGSIVPNNYKVIYVQNSQLQEGHIQELIYNQTFAYVNWSGSIKVPAIIQYAKKCVTFNKDYMQKKEVPESLENKLYFI